MTDYERLFREQFARDLRQIADKVERGECDVVDVDYHGRSDGDGSRDTYLFTLERATNETTLEYVHGRKKDE